MSFLRSKSQQLADHLRGCISRGELREPLPSIRAWSTKLGIGLHTLEMALQVLHREGVVQVRPRQGIRLLAVRSARNVSEQSRVVRWVCYSKNFPDLSAYMEAFEAILERLQPHHLGFSIERCNAARLRFLHGRGESPQEMFLLASLPREFEVLFDEFRRSAMILGYPSTGVSLPFINIDVFSAIRHATHHLARRGFSKVTLVVQPSNHHPADEIFLRSCAEVPRPLEAEVVVLPMELVEQVAAAERFANRVTGRQGIIAVYSISASLLMTALMARGVRIPVDVEVIAVNCTSQAVRVSPLPTYYPYPVAAYAKAISNAALQYFERGALPRLRKTIPLEAVHPAAS